LAATASVDKTVNGKKVVGRVAGKVGPKLLVLGLVDRDVVRGWRDGIGFSINKRDLLTD